MRILGGQAKAGRIFGILCRSVLKIAEADSTSVFSGVFPVLLEHAVLWVKLQPGGLYAVLLHIYPAPFRNLHTL
jgi:hypothetical protein